MCMQECVCACVCVYKLAATYTYAGVNYSPGACVGRVCVLECVDLSTLALV